MRVRKCNLYNIFITDDNDIWKSSCYLQIFQQEAQLQDTTVCGTSRRQECVCECEEFAEFVHCVCVKLPVLYEPFH